MMAFKTLAAMAAVCALLYAAALVFGPAGGTVIIAGIAALHAAMVALIVTK